MKRKQHQLYFPCADVVFSFVKQKDTPRKIERYQNFITDKF